MIKASIVIPAYNRRRILEKALLCLKEQSCDKSLFEVLIADDGSTDDVSQLLKRPSKELNLRYFYQKKKGAASARNKAIEKAKGEIIIFLDSDIFASQELVEEHIRFHQQGDGIIVQGPVIQTHNLNRFVAGKKLTDFYNTFFSTGNSSIRKKYLIEAGGFDEGFTEYGWEDLELGFRLKKLALKPLWNKKAVGYHYREKESLNNLKELCERERQRGHMAVRFYKKHPTFEVRAMTLFIEPLFTLDRLVMLGDWYKEKGTEKILKFLQEKGSTFLLSFFIKLIKTHYYFEGMREKLKEN